ncbi:sigma-70 family RNA polymerase sigma factor [Bacillus sp. FJAT-27245]|uniref:sigma-70 family RNA polymerase sigma factor n=1 Tax=Bacillus sp. FJAT-27245 TaxID=1684144 RepID=UPI0006A78CF5|nr:sigma-70 family RNA polymerase sigma factor [Bacillus sp. FJAT-27245]
MELYSENKPDLQQSLNEIMDRYGTELSILAFSYVKDIEAAKDIVQNVFVKCYTHIHSFQGKSSLRTWLYRITINECKDYLKSSYLKRIFLGGRVKEEPTHQTPEAVLLKKSEDEQVIMAIMSLGKKYREVMILRYIHHLEVKEIAHVLEVSAETVKTRIRRAKMKLLPVVKEELLYE